LLFRAIFVCKYFLASIVINILSVKDPLSEDKKTAAALLRAKGYSEMDIAHMLGISQGSVPTCLKWAKEKGFLTIPSPVFAESLVPPALMAKVSALVDHEGLRQSIDKFVKVSFEKRVILPVRVFPSGSHRTTDAAWKSRLQRFGQACSPYVLSLLRKATTVGISWGSTAASVVAAIEEMEPTPSLRTRVIPLGGEPLGASLNLASSSTLAARLQVRLGNDTPPLSLAAIPALVPLSFKTRREITTITSLIGLVRDYRTIFIGDTRRVPVVDSIDCVLCSVSPADRVWGDDLIRSGQLDVHDLRELVHGDVCGVLLARAGMEKRVSLLSKRWTCVQKSHLEACAKRGNADSKTASDGRTHPGIIVVAIGANKAKCVFECLRQRLVNHLVIDDDLADELKKLIDTWLERTARIRA
jgi:DNA-binding transcriptional regulator LsrR (DeoR family)